MIKIIETMKRIFVITSILCMQAVVYAQSPAIEMIFVEGGTFTMGCTPEQGKDCPQIAKPAHQVTLDGFYIGKYEVTQAQWEEVMGNIPSMQYKGKNKPVACSWLDTQKFIRKLNQKTGLKYRLLTESEWEYAARGGNKSKGYKYSGSDKLDEVAWYEDNANYDRNNKGPRDVGTKKANELGIHDMSGNACEWVWDFYAPYSSEPQNNPKGPEIGETHNGYTIHILRGGAWGNGGPRSEHPESLSLVNRSRWHLKEHGNGNGFRLALDK
jgi:formylglycine-generating enzyme required for sulfatase activity